MTIYESAAITLLDTIFPSLAPFVGVADALYEAIEKNPAALQTGLSIPLSLKGIKYNISITAA